MNTPTLKVSLYIIVFCWFCLTTVLWCPWDFFLFWSGVMKGSWICPSLIHTLLITSFFLNNTSALPESPVKWLVIKPLFNYDYNSVNPRRCFLVPCSVFEVKEGSWIYTFICPFWLKFCSTISLLRHEALLFNWWPNHAIV